VITALAPAAEMPVCCWNFVGNILGKICALAGTGP
jgi:hypothetical protein